MVLWTESTLELENVVFRMNLSEIKEFRAFEVEKFHKNGDEQLKIFLLLDSVSMVNG